jgi:hypothetical protein
LRYDRAKLRALGVPEVECAECVQADHTVRR